jgi:hypothetical protein
LRVTKGWYYYGDWDTTHNPLFVVGGLNPPPFISVRGLDNGTIEWNYIEWTGSEQAFPLSLGVTVLVLVAVTVVMALSVVILRSRRGGSSTEPHT